MSILASASDSNESLESDWQSGDYSMEGEDEHNQLERQNKVWRSFCCVVIPKKSPQFHRRRHLKFEATAHFLLGVPFGVRETLPCAVLDTGILG
jgi:hypothetical protein